MIGRIYRIVHMESEICYIGSTLDELRNRWQGHKRGYGEWKAGKGIEITIYPFFRKHGIDQFKMILIKEYEVADRSHLEAYEQLYINKFRKIAVNKRSAFRIPRLSQKLAMKEYREGNKEKVKESNKRYKETNRDKIKMNHKQYKEKNREKIKETHPCECGGKYQLGTKAQHLRTTKHQKWLSAQ
jgi:hypothetical protein